MLNDDIGGCGMLLSCPCHPGDEGGVLHPLRHLFFDCLQRQAASNDSPPAAPVSLVPYFIVIFPIKLRRLIARLK